MKYGKLTSTIVASSMLIATQGGQAEARGFRRGPSLFWGLAAGAILAPRVRAYSRPYYTVQAPAPTSQYATPSPAAQINVLPLKAPELSKNGRFCTFQPQNQTSTIEGVRFAMEDRKFGSVQFLKEDINFKFKSNETIYLLRTSFVEGANRHLIYAVETKDNNPAGLIPVAPEFVAEHKPVLLSMIANRPQMTGDCAAVIKAGPKPK